MYNVLYSIKVEAKMRATSLPFQFSQVD